MTRADSHASSVSLWWNIFWVPTSAAFLITFLKVCSPTFSCFYSLLLHLEFLINELHTCHCFLIRKQQKRAVNLRKVVLDSDVGFTRIERSGLAFFHSHSNEWVFSAFISENNRSLIWAWKRGDIFVSSLKCRSFVFERSSKTDELRI